MVQALVITCICVSVLVFDIYMDDKVAVLQKQILPSVKGGFDKSYYSRQLKMVQ